MLQTYLNLRITLQKFKCLNYKKFMLKLRTKSILIKHENIDDYTNYLWCRNSPLILLSVIVGTTMSTLVLRTGYKSHAN